MPARLLQQIDNRADQARVTFVKQSIKVAASPSELDHELRVEGARDGSQFGQGDLLEMTTLEERHDALRHARAASHIDLAPTKAVSQRTKPSSDSDIHRTRLPAAPYLPVT